MSFYRPRFIHPEEQRQQEIPSSDLLQKQENETHSKHDIVLVCSSIHRCQLHLLSKDSMPNANAQEPFLTLSFPGSIFITCHLTCERRKRGSPFLTAASFVFLSLNSDLCISLSRQDAIN